MGCLRLLLALGVVSEHAGRALFAASYTAVQIFFMISGFYMALILSSGRYGNSRDFYASRLARLFPVYWVALSLGVIFAFSVYVLTGTDSAISNLPRNLMVLWESNFFASVWVVFSNIFLVFADFSWFVSGIDGVKHPTQLMVQAPVWTLALEIYFYALCPFLVRTKTVFLVVLAFISLLGRVVGYEYGLNENPYHARFFPFEILFFLSGILAYRLYESKNMIAYILKGRVGGAIALGYMLCVVFFYDLVKLFPAPSAYGGFKDYWHSVLLCALTFPALISLFSTTKNSGIDHQLGELSYPVYVVHYAFVSTLLHTGVLKPWGIPVFWVILILTLLAAFLMHKFVQIPVDRFRIGRFVSIEENVGR